MFTITFFRFGLRYGENKKTLEGIMDTTNEEAVVVEEILAADLLCGNVGIWPW